jgi:hypothetical protein
VPLQLSVMSCTAHMVCYIVSVDPNPKEAIFGSACRVEGFSKWQK